MGINWDIYKNSCYMPNFGSGATTNFWNYDNYGFGGSYSQPGVFNWSSSSSTDSTSNMTPEEYHAKQEEEHKKILKN